MVTNEIIAQKRLTKNQGILAWHYLGSDGLTANGENIMVIAGQTLKIKGPIVLCSNGYHASVKPLDALDYAPGTIVQRCILWGNIEYGDDKLVASNRTCLWVAGATNALLEFACWCAEQAFDEIRKIGLEPDQRSIQAINVVRLWIEHKVTNDELYAASYAASNAARYAARYAARSASDAASYAASDAASYARYAARYASNASNASNASDAASDVASAKQNEKLEELLLALEPVAPTPAERG